MRELIRMGVLMLTAASAAGCALERDCAGDRVEIQGDGVTLTGRCGAGSVRLLPAALVDGAWRGGLRDGPCRAEADRVICPAGEAGEVALRLLGSQRAEALVWLVELRAAREVTLEALAMEGPARIDGATSWLSNGFQSWSQSGVVSLGPAVSESALEQALAARGDLEVVRSGNELSWWLTYVGGGGPALFAGALTGNRFKPWAEVRPVVDSAAGNLHLRLVSGGAGEKVRLRGGEYAAGESWRLEVGADLHAMLTRYGRSLSAHKNPASDSAAAGWCSWYQIWDAVDEAAVRANAALAGEILRPLLPAGSRPRILVDDGWQRAWGDWQPNARFPSGLDGLARDLKAQGFAMGVWLAPLLVAADTALAREHPEWFVGGVEYNHIKNGRMRVLDVTHPEAAAHLAATIRRIVGWGYTLLKIDFLFAGTYEGRRYEDVTGMQAYHRALQILREAAGESTTLVAVAIPPVASFPYVDVWRVGFDIAVEQVGPSWHFAVSQARSLGARWFLCLATPCDPDAVLLRALSREEVEFGAWVVALAGGGLFLSDDLRLLPPERRGWGLGEGRVALATGGKPSFPENLFPAPAPATLSTAIADSILGVNSHVVPTIWRTPDGRRVALNVGERPLTVGSMVVPPRGARVVEPVSR
jgi:hypothetical protein